ncbi:hypothetical protein LTR56_011109 [Elasticomyces elasticus]|nr:hypothetical protein LTR56_011109 [Elasticomyces elasticus]KAK4926459.1 hypothetical protein LTR49_006666 [Elasticomyces elasticus]KAK5761167.1 hypothetical protein LTS12_008648 [Elasticomyces elasticus]
MKDGLKGGVMHLQEIRMQLEHYLADYDYLYEGDVVSAFSPRKGLYILKCGGMASEWATELQTHIAEVEETRKAFNLQGEAIIMALSIKTELWSFDSDSFAAKGPEQ